jgi:DNA-binding CsgD family transcriptional regulator
MTRSARELIMTLVEDPWQARLNRMRQLLPLPMLAVSAAVTFAVPASAFHRWARFELALPLTAAAALLWAVASLPAIEAGATGYLLKDAPRDELIRAVRAAHQGQSVLAPTVASTLVGLVGSPGGRGQRGQENLSPREIEVLKLVADGATNQVAARKLLVSETTIKTHLLHIYTKLGVRDRASAVATAYKRGLLS